MAVETLPARPSRLRAFWASVTTPDAGLAWALAIVTFASLLATERAVGFTRDESFYFYAADLYTPWVLGLFDALIHGRIAESFSDPALVRAFGYNWEHPILMKVSFGLSHWLFYEQLHWLRPAAAYRAPAWALGALASALTYLIGVRLFAGEPQAPERAAALPRARWLAAFAVGAFWLTPRSLYDGHLACFDMPISVAWLLVVYCYLRAAEAPDGSPRRRWAVLTGVAYGLALCIKLNSFFYPATFVVHWALTRAPRAYREGRFKGLWRALPRQWLWMALLGPSIFFVHWPYLWPHPVDRISQYLAFHAQHVNYPWTYLGEVLRGPTFPILYVVVLTALTVPLPLFALMLSGTFALCGRMFEGLRRPGGPSATDSAWLLVLFNALCPMLLISWPTVPHFGGTKHWLPGMPFLSLIAADALWRCGATLGRFAKRAPAPFAAALGAGTLACALIGCVHIGGFGDSAYNELAGEGAGAAQLGMQRQFWSNNVTGVFDWLNRNAPMGARIYFHEVTQGSVSAYQQNGMLRTDIRGAGSANDAQLVPYQYMQEFRQQEFDIWNAFGTSAPVAGLYLDEAPNITVYRRPGY